MVNDDQHIEKNDEDHMPDKHKHRKVAAEILPEKPRRKQKREPKSHEQDEANDVAKGKVRKTYDDTKSRKVILVQGSSSEEDKNDEPDLKDSSSEDEDQHPALTDSSSDDDSESEEGLTKEIIKKYGPEIRKAQREIDAEKKTGKKTA